MTINEPNHYARNLKFVSTLFILYWVLGLEPTSDEIRLAFVNYKITNAGMLVWVAHFVLFYVLWAFLVSERYNFYNDFKVHFSNKWATSWIKIKKNKHIKNVNDDYLSSSKVTFESKYLSDIKKDKEAGIGPYAIELTGFRSGFNTNKPILLMPYIQYVVSYPNFQKSMHGSKIHGMIKIPKLSIHFWLFIILIPIYFLKFSIIHRHFQDSVLPLILFVLAVFSSICNWLSMQFPFG